MTCIWTWEGWLFLAAIVDVFARRVVGYDLLVSVADCGHNTWESAHRADKARKGITKLEGRGDWQSMQHCPSCKGGGMWRVRW